MAEVQSITVDTKAPGTFSILFRHAVIWTFLVGSEGISHLWFGGSWVIDLMILIALCLFVARQAMNGTGTSVRMTDAEVRLWVAAGMPRDVKAWRANSKISVAA